MHLDTIHIFGFCVFLISFILTASIWRQSQLYEPYVEGTHFNIHV